MPFPSTKRLLRLLFNTLTAASLIALLLNLVGISMMLAFRWSNYLKTGNFTIDGSLSAAHQVSEIEIAFIKSTVFSMVLPLLWLFDRRRKQRASRRLASGHCTKCGYDLRATPEQCPECGTIPPGIKQRAV